MRCGKGFVWFLPPLFSLSKSQISGILNSPSHAVLVVLVVLALLKVLIVLIVLVVLVALVVVEGVLKNV